jgi:hypothetical protein
MKVNFKPIPDGPLTFELEAADDTSLFEQLAHVQSLFGDTCCGKCKGTNLQFRVRKAGKNAEFTYYERVCQDCGAKLDYGQNRQGRSMYTKRTIQDNGRNVYDKEHQGWYVWDGQPEQPKAPPPVAPRRAVTPPQRPVAVQRPAPVPEQGDAYEGPDEEPWEQNEQPF